MTGSAEGLSVWVLTDGKIGDDVQCLAIAGALSSGFEKRVIAPRWPWALMAPWGPIDPKDNPSNPESPIAGAPPDIVVTSGRRAIPYGAAIKKANPSTKLIVLKDPRFGRNRADFIWAPAHDHLSGINVFSTLTSPHALSAAIKDRRGAGAGWVDALASPRLGVILGGPSGGAIYDRAAAQTLGDRLSATGKTFGAIVVTPSRRTPDDFLEHLKAEIHHASVHIWDGNGQNPYVDILAKADALIVAGDSHNMVSESLAAGRSVYVWEPPGFAKKLNWFIAELVASGMVSRFENTVVPGPQEPVDATGEIVREIRSRLGLG